MVFEMPLKQRALQINPAGQTRFVDNVDVPLLDQYQILAKVEVVCVSDHDLKFQQSSKKSKHSTTAGEDSLYPYIFNDAVITVVSIGDKVSTVEPGLKYLLLTSCCSPEHLTRLFSKYVFGGVLQEYIVIDERKMVSQDGIFLMLPLSEENNLSSIALCLSWARVEQAYTTQERSCIDSSSKMLVVIDSGFDANIFTAFLGRFGKPERLNFFSRLKITMLVDLVINFMTSIDAVYTFDDDIIYYGACPETITKLFGKLDAGGLLNVVLNGSEITQKVSLALSDIQLRGLRMVGTDSNDPSESMENIPTTAQIPLNSHVSMIGVKDNNSLIHGVKNLLSSKEISALSIYCSNENSLEVLGSVLGKFSAGKCEKCFIFYSQKVRLKANIDYALVFELNCESISQALQSASQNSFINLAVDVPEEDQIFLDLNVYIQKHLYFLGSTGLEVDVLRRVIAKLETDTVDTNLPVTAICGLRSATEVITAIQHQDVVGTVVVYPQLTDLPFLRIKEVSKLDTGVAQYLIDGQWNGRAEKALLYSKKFRPSSQ